MTITNIPEHESPLTAYPMLDRLKNIEGNVIDSPNHGLADEISDELPEPEKLYNHQEPNVKVMKNGVKYDETM